MKDSFSIAMALAAQSSQLRILYSKTGGDGVGIKLPVVSLSISHYFFQPSSFLFLSFFPLLPTCTFHISCILYIFCNPSLLQNADIPPLHLADALLAGIVSAASDSARPGPRNHHRQHTANKSIMGDQASRRHGHWG